MTMENRALYAMFNSYVCLPEGMHPKNRIHLRSLDMYIYIYMCVCGFPEMVVPPNGWFSMENPSTNVPTLMETPICWSPTRPGEGGQRSCQGSQRAGSADEQNPGGLSSQLRFGSFWASKCLVLGLASNHPTIHGGISMRNSTGFLVGNDVSTLLDVAWRWDSPAKTWDLTASLTSKNGWFNPQNLGLHKQNDDWTSNHT